ncbi:hypothetical protein O181_036346 [Austropuccinia psidii MF-1]|uniref:Uncharacterized protein n=1 Tax=Austropuccinia psidii MF-1 TaxID=1389203 RepID=A0A9Q3H9U9_9BASI|nr:hypothetical protein [Austropuccinia psidii MF-1]
MPSSDWEKALTPQEAPKRVIDMIIAEAQGSVNESQTENLCCLEAYTTILPSSRAETSTRSLNGHMKSNPECIQKFTSTQRGSNSRRSLENLHEVLPDCEKASGPYQYFQVTEWRESIYEKEVNNAFNSRIEEK